MLLMSATRLIALLVVVVAAQIAAADERASDKAAANWPARNWPAWRGPLAAGLAPEGNPPLAWGEGEGTNTRWKTPIPGRGHSTPIVWGERIYLTAAIPVG